VADFELVSNHLCPYTQRAAILLAEKGVACERRYIDLANKPDWFLAISPLGKVPLLRVQDAVIFETSVICEYIEEVTPLPLLPAQPLERARHRGWAEFASATIGDIHALYTAANEDAFVRKRDDLKSKFGWLERHLDAAPYFTGARLSLVDAAFAPIYRLFDTFDRIADFEVFEGLPRVRAHRAALAAHDKVREVVVADYGEIFHRYLLARDSHLSRLMRGA
jgi:glutathione S-transferase